MNRNRKISVSGKKGQDHNGRATFNTIKSLKKRSDQKEHKNRMHEGKKSKKQIKRKPQLRQSNEYTKQFATTDKLNWLNLKQMQTKHTYCSTAEEFYLEGAKWYNNRRITKLEEPPKTEHSSEGKKQKVRQRMVTICSSAERKKEEKRKLLPCKIIKCSRIPFAINKKDHVKVQRRLFEEENNDHQDSQYFPNQDNQIIQ